MKESTYKTELWLISVLSILLLGAVIFYSFKILEGNPTIEVGQKIDSLNGVYVYHNDGIRKVHGRNLAPDGYNLGLKYQCVEFVKRYYYERFNHKMPDSYGNAKDFFNPFLKDGEFNEIRGLLQFSNPSSTQPQVNDILIFSPTLFNQFGHVAIVSQVKDNEMETIQQNAGAFSSSRATYPLKFDNGKWKIQDSNALGFLRKKIIKTENFE